MKIQKIFYQILTSIFTLLIIFPGFLAIQYTITGCQLPAPPHPEPGTPTQANTDGYNYKNDSNRSNDFIYNQLWYFNFLDDRGTPETSDDIAGVAAYGLANPENLATGGGLTNSFGMIIRDLPQGASFAAYSPHWDPTVPGNFYASTTFEPGPGFEFQNPGGTIDVISSDEYHVVGQSVEGDREIDWDLTYTRNFEPRWQPWVDWPMPATMGIIPAWITYHMHMPNALVNGTFYVKDGTDEVTYTLTDAQGYHDGFYSEFVFSILEWDWLDYKQDNLSIHLLHPHAPEYSCQGGWETCLPGNLRVVYDSGSSVKEYNFLRGKNPDEKQIWINYVSTEYDTEYDVYYPLEEIITAVDDAGNTLILQWSLIRYLKIYFDVPDPFKDTVTFEMISDFTGTFCEASSGTIVPISGPGWSDWSGPAFPGS